MEKLISEPILQTLAAVGDAALIVIAALMAILVVRMFALDKRLEILSISMEAHVNQDAREFKRVSDTLKEHADHIGKHYSMIHDNSTDIAVLKGAKAAG